MVNSQAYKRAFICAGIFWIFFYLFMIAMNARMGGTSDNAFILGYTLFPWLMSGAITGCWAAGSKQLWNWNRYAITVFGLWLLITWISERGKGK